MKVTDDMINNACRAYNERAFSNSSPAGIRAALGAALADVPEPVPGPFVLTDYEKKIVSNWRHENTATDVLCAAIDRAVRTLGPAPAPVEPLKERSNAEWVMKLHHADSGEYRVAAELLRRCPAPAQKQKTAAELISFLRQEVSGRAGVSQALDAITELLRLAEIGAAK